MVSLLRDHVQDVPKALRAALPPSLVHSERHVLGTLLPTQKLNIGLTLLCTLSIIKAWPREDTYDLGKLHNTLRKRCRAMLQVLKGLLVHVSLLLHLPHCITGLLDVDLMGGTLHSQAIGFLPELQDVTLVLPETTLNTAHAQI